MRECEECVGQYEERLHQLDKDMRRKMDIQAALLEKAKNDDAREDANDAQKGVISMFNEQKRYELYIQRLQSEVQEQ